MPYDGSGNFNRVMDWTNDAAANIKIKADRHDSEDDNFAAGLSNVITKDGQTQPTANIPLNGKKLVNVGTPTVATDGSTKGYADTKAPIASPTFTGKVTLPTGAAGSAPLAFPAGVAPTTPADGDVWAGANTAAAGAIRQRILGVTYSYARLELDQVFTGKLGVNNAAIPAGAVSGMFLSGSLTMIGGVYSFNAYFDTTWKAASTGWAGYHYLDLSSGVISLARSNASVAAGAIPTMTNVMTIDTGNTVTFLGRINYADYLVSSTVTAILAATGAGTCYFRPNGVGSSTGQLTYSSAGDLVAAGNVSAYSDPRLKDDVEPITDALDIINALDGVRFTWNTRSKIIGSPGKRDVGVLADQVERVLPEIVGLSVPDEDAGGERWQTVAYDKLVPVLIEAVKTLAARVEQLEERT